MQTRREFIKKSTLLTGGLGLSSLLPASIQRAMAINPAPGSTYLDAEHVVILMQENRSFDHLFGSLQGVRGFNDPRAITLASGNPVWVQQNAAGNAYVPFRLDIKDTKATWMGSLPHDRSSQVDAFNNGQFDKWLEAKKSYKKNYSDMPLTLGFYNREDLPFHYAMADAFTICDQHFSSAMTSTWPNRHFMWTGKIREKDGSKAHIRNDLDFAEAKWRTFPELLEDNNVSWKIYQNDINCYEKRDNAERAWLANYICNMMEYFEQYNIKYAESYIRSIQEKLEDLPKQINELKEKLTTLSSSDTAAKKMQADLKKKQGILAQAEVEAKQFTRANYEKLSQREKNLHEKAFTINSGDPDYKKLTTLKYKDGSEDRELAVPKGDVLYQLRKDADNNQLPTVSWIVAPENFSDHPSAPWYGSWYISEILDILTKNPEVWKKTIFILTYDENDGYFDHIPPFIPPNLSKPGTGKCSAGISTDQHYIKRETELAEGASKNEARDGVIGMGYRIPLIIASPWSRGGKVCSQVFDHTSSLQFLEKFLANKTGRKIKEDNIDDWRRTVSGDLTSVFTPFNGTEKKINFLKRDAHIESIYNAKFKQDPTGFKKLTDTEIEEIKQKPANNSLLPRQEKGTRPACALPYELYADGKLNKDKKQFEMTMMAGDKLFKNRSAGSAFKVYAPGKFNTLAGQQELALKSWDYAVKAGDALNDSWPLDAFENGNYHLRLYGPNGFYREFMGNYADPELTSIRLVNGTSGPELIISIALPLYSSLLPKNSYKVEIIHNGYKNATINDSVTPYKPSLRIPINITDSHGWYDFTVKVEGYDNYHVRYAGHFENGKETTTDPVMGGAI